MKFILEFETEGACFAGRREQEIACILETIATRFRNCSETGTILAKGTIMDRNGNSIGKFNSVSSKPISQ
jgi:hypothetical protein